MRSFVRDTSVHGSNCITMHQKSEIPTIRCPKGYHYCLVKRFVENNQLTTFERGCSDSCFTGCITVGEPAYSLEQCSSCCITPNCNTDNVANIVDCNIMLLVTLIAFVMITSKT
ncbi:uncharacterized protein LOC141904682 [Tubulanus polymorphus]|uniref:uncharacterized protein LOC141904682 n=1 Tax=Tubulanus polymorphus TaxID=672921 RepID=UPI003DA48F2D